MHVEVIVNNLFKSTTNIVMPSEHDNAAWVVDCGDSGEIIRYVQEKRLDVCGILLTHGHFDHIYGLNEVLESFPHAQIYTNESGVQMLGNSRKNMSHYWGQPIVVDKGDNVILVEDSSEIQLSNDIIARAVFTPGHNPSCVTWVIGDCIFTGDSYIPGIKTVTNLPGGNRQQAEESLKLIQELSIGRSIYPGHGV